MQHPAKVALSKLCLGALGRRNTARLGRFLLNEARFDVPNDPRVNGEHLLQRCVLAARPEGPVVAIDVGANVGAWSTQLIATGRDLGVQDLSVHAFEPAPSTAAALRENLLRISNGFRAFVYESAASSRQGTGTLHVPNPLAGTSSLVVRSGRDTSDAADVAVSLVTLDDFCAEHKLDSILLCKSDAEGHDMEVLSGAQTLLGKGAIAVFQFEYNWRWIAGRHFLRDAFELSENIDYRLGKVTPKGIEFYERWSAELETFCEANYVLCRSDFSRLLPHVRWWNEDAPSLS